MSYVVLALRWRPNNFDELIGQDHVVTSLKSSIEKERVAHAYLFAGSRGVGKTSAARILAKALNCTDRVTANPCGKCPVCTEITEGRSLDVIEIDGASNRGIDEIRALRENVKFAPTRGKFKVYIIDEVHQITADGFNALLKTLEEPPPFVKFIFATTQPNKVMPTILSRCQRLDFRRISVMEIIGQLEKIVRAEGIDIDNNVLAAIARSSDGALRDAESILDQLISFSRGKVSLEDVNRMLGLMRQDILFEITNKIIARDAAGSLVLLNQVIDEGRDIGVFMTSLIEHFRNLMIAKVAQADSELIDLPQDICEKLKDQAQFFTLEEIFNAFGIMVNTQEMAKRLESIRIPLEVTLVRLAHNKKGGISSGAQVSKSARTEPVRPVPGKSMGRDQGGAAAGPRVPADSDKRIQDAGHIGAVKKQPSSGGKPFQSPFKKDIKNASSAPAPVSSSAQDTAYKKEPPRVEEVINTAVLEEGRTVTLEEVKNNWQKILSRVGSVKIYVGQYLSEGAPLEMDKNAVVIAFPKSCSFHKESLETKENKSIIEKVLFDIFEVRTRIKFTLTDMDSSSKNDNSQDSTLVKSILDAFNGRVVREDYDDSIH